MSEVNRNPPASQFEASAKVALAEVRELLSQQKYEEAAGASDSALDRFSGDHQAEAELLLLRGQALLHLARPAEAEKDFPWRPRWRRSSKAKMSISSLKGKTGLRFAFAVTIRRNLRKAGGRYGASLP
jgi:hypothetical protein